MQVNEVASRLITRSGLATNSVSSALGKSREWARQASRLDRIPRLDTIADIADVAGVDVVLVDRATGDTVGVVEPPRRAASEH